MKRDLNRPLPFVLPRLRTSSVSEFLSFRKETTSILGVYEAGYAPLVFEPTTLKNRTPEGTLAHEETHQHLTINTTFGLFYQTLEKFAKSQSIGTYCKAYRRSLEEQWSVQELDATYAEMFFVGTMYPDDLEKTIAELPTEILDQPPYRQVFDSMAQYLPIDKTIGHPRLFAQRQFVHAVSCLSLSCDCLTRFMNRATFDLDSFERYLTQESPHIRFERIMSRLIIEGKEKQLVEAIESETGPSISRGHLPTEDPFRWLLPQVSELSGVGGVFERGELLRAAKEFAKGWDQDIEEKPEEPLSTIAVHPEVWINSALQLRQKLSLTADRLLAELQIAREARLGVVLKLSVGIGGDDIWSKV